MLQSRRWSDLFASNTSWSNFFVSNTKLLHKVKKSGHYFFTLVTLSETHYIGISGLFVPMLFSLCKCTA